MDTTEELNGTYFYKEISNVNPGGVIFFGYYSIRLMRNLAV